MTFGELWGPVLQSFAFQKKCDVGSKHYNLHDYAEEKREALIRWASVIRSLVTGQDAAVVPIAAARREAR